MSYIIYNCNIDIMSIKVPEWDNKQHPALVIKHEFDSEWLLIVLEEFEKNFRDKRKQLLAKSLEYSKETMEPINETNRYSFGKIRIRIKSLDVCPNIGKLFVRIRLGPFFQETRRVKGPLKNKYKFNQDFFFPITNKFDQIYI